MLSMWSRRKVQVGCITYPLSMSEVTIEGKLLRWGNSYGIRIKKDDVEASDLHPGEEVVVRIEHGGGRLDLSELPTFSSGHADTGDRHDAVLGEARSDEHARGRSDPADDSGGEASGESS